MNSPTIVNLSSLSTAEAAKAKFWRKNVMKMSRAQLCKAIGYSLSSISLFEQGYDHNGKPLGERAWMRYRLACAGLTALNAGIPRWPSEDCFTA